ncbi:MAG TPA: hypothetical protein VFB49_00775 [Patescibacteria group bacterium]|nr:hypothetical protein [Patescibacteria group bacterium]
MLGTARLHRMLRPAVLAAAAVSILFPPAVASAADLFYNATIGLKVNDDARFFLNLTNEHYAVPEPTAVAVVKRCPRPQDDYPVVMLLARASGRSADAILSMRLHGAPWVDVFARCQVSPDVLFVGMDRDPGPPYGHAWGYWKKHDHGGDARAALSDVQITDLAKLQIVSGYYHVSPYTVVAERQRGSTIERYAVVHGRPAGAVAAKQGHPGHGPRPERGDDGHGPHDQGHGQGHGAGHGHDQGHGHDDDHGPDPR